MAVAEGVDLGRAIGGADGEPPEGRLQRLQQICAEPAAGGDGEVGIVRDVAQAVKGGDFGLEESRRKKFSESLTRPSSSRPFMLAGLRMVCPPPWRLGGG